MLAVTILGMKGLASSVPWCARCDRTTGSFVLAVDGANGVRMLCMVCADGKTTVSMPIQGVAVSDEKREPTEKENVPVSPDKPIRSEHAEALDTAKDQEQATREGEEES